MEEVPVVQAAAQLFPTEIRHAKLVAAAGGRAPDRLSEAAAILAPWATGTCSGPYSDADSSLCVEK